jgi:predicted unusual protein kinase regulating ubiquinone biosynthesis (AarF/ABC1/UbiB family)
VIKVLRPEVPRLLRTDMQLLRVGAWAAELLRPELKWLALRGAVDTFGMYLRQQTDFTVEGANLRRLGANFVDAEVWGGVMRVPRVIVDMADLLVTTRAPGKSLTEFIKETKGKGEAEEARERVFHGVTDAMARMILVHKFIHGDLHPGNLFVHFADGSSRPEITLIDAGISIEIPDDMASMMSGSVLAVWNREGRKLGQAIVSFHNNSNLTDHAVDLEELEVKVGNLILAGSILCREVKDKHIWSEMFETYQEYRESRVSEYFALLAGRLSRHKVRVSPALWSVMTAFALIEGSMYELGHGVDVLRCARPYVIPGYGALKKVSSLLPFN